VAPIGADSYSGTSNGGPEGRAGSGLSR
jgi:hypothetical protein